ncbi:LGFP repeat-containing protein [Specibacter cremeus]|uniref:LGFP repeat-containing protein n=1 Tax=Specibacter cremeus TaxID=1629051 RepID=UPI0013DDF786|nr:hypothetical protein [Specibacter cremeus]
MTFGLAAPAQASPAQASPVQASTIQAATADGGAIAAKYSALGGAAGYLGAPINNLRCGLVAGGCVRSYRNGIIYWVKAAGAHPVRGAIGAK